MQIFVSPPTNPVSPASIFVTSDSRALNILSGSTTLGVAGILGEQGLQSVGLRLPTLKSIGNKATVLANAFDKKGNIIKIAFTFEKVGENVIRASSGFPGTGSAVFSNFDIHLGDGGIVLGFDTNLDGRINSVTPPTLSVQAPTFGAQPLRVLLNILSFGGASETREEEAGEKEGTGEEETDSFLTPYLSLNTLLTAQSSPDTSSASTTDSGASSTDTSTTGTTDTGTGGNGPSDFALQQGRKNGF